MSRPSGSTRNPGARGWFPARWGRRLALAALVAALCLPAAGRAQGQEAGAAVAATDSTAGSGAGGFTPGLDILLRTTDDPGLLGTARLVQRERLLRQGVDPLREPGRQPDLASLWRRQWRQRSNVDLVREESLLEFNNRLGVVTRFSHPKYFNLMPLADTLPGGFIWYPPRPVGDDVVDVFVDDIDAYSLRSYLVATTVARSDLLNVVGGTKDAQDSGLINLTIPVKLPRTLEKIIGKGEKTQIKITGREHIALNGESTVTKPFVASERVSSQSLFPTLDMEQQLSINLSGTIGEKIILEVDHNSEQVGPDATKIKLMYRGLDDEVIRTIETGDVGLTLPGSQLVGYSSNKSGLFGVKVTGQVGRAEFTVVASKQKAEASSKQFNASGGQVSDNSIPSYAYLNNRFFKLDIPESEAFGRASGEKILYSSLKVFRMMSSGVAQPDDISYVAAYIDYHGCHAWGDSVDFAVPEQHGPRWREITAFDPMLDAGGNLIAIDMRTQMDQSDVLAVVYTVVDAAGNVVAQVGDNPSLSSERTQEIGADSVNKYYRMKLLKGLVTAPRNDQRVHVFNYVLRNIYSLGGANIDPATFDLRIEQTTPNDGLPAQDRGVDYIRIFGLDRRNAQGEAVADGVVDADDPFLIDLVKGLLKFPLDFPRPFAADQAQYEAYAAGSTFAWDGSYISDHRTSEIYDYGLLQNDFSQYEPFRIVARHAAAASSFNLGASNIEEGSETVTIDGRTLTRNVDYEIDYTFGEIQLKGDAANLTADSKISVDYQYAPFMGGGNTSLMGLSLGYDLGRESKLGTSWLFQSESIVGEKAKLGEEPSKNLVGNLNLQHTFKPRFLTSVANFLSRNDSERESSVQFLGEFAISVPNPNTKGQVYLEDFEGVDASDMVTLNRLGWSWASQPRLGAAWLAAHPDTRQFLPRDRVPTLRWFLPKERVLRRYLNPDLVNQERDETQTVMDMYLRSEGPWRQDNWGGIMRGMSRTGLDLSKSQFVEVWINDGIVEAASRSGRLHFDFGYINEDGFWPEDTDGLPVTGTYQQEDGIVNKQPDGVWTYEEDIGLAGIEADEYLYNADYVGADDPFPRINNTARNNREDTEDLNANGRLDQIDGYYTVSIDLKDSPALVDVLRDYDNVEDLVASGFAWRKYRIPLAAVDSVAGNTAANIKAVTHARIWYENDSLGAPSTVHLQLSDLRFLGSRWDREGVRRIDGEQLLSRGERLPDEEFFLGEVNNKENPDYSPPFGVHVENNIPDKEQSLVLNFQDLERGHLMRISKQVSPRGDDYTGYRNMSWYWYNPSHDTADLDLLFRVGADSLNYYEVAYRFSDSQVKTGWHRSSLGLAELSNAKTGELAEDGSLHALVPDLESGEEYRVRVVGRPDLRRVRRYYVCVANNALIVPANGYIYINDVRLEGVKRDQGMAERAGVRLNMADVFKVDFDWRHTDDEYHGLDKRVGSGVDHGEWSLNNSFNVEDFFPLAGFRLPVSGSRRQTIDRPKYVTNSDIEIIDPDMLVAMSSISTREQFSARLNHTPAKSATLRYLVDPWQVQLSGSREKTDSPLQLVRAKSLQGGVNYDLRISGNYALGAYPVLRWFPVIKGFSIVPRRVALGASFSSTEGATTTISETGLVTVRPVDRKQLGKLTGSVDYSPLSITDLAFGVTSDRDLLREERVAGLNIGKENRRSYDLRMTVSPPKGVKLPAGALFAPARLTLRAIDRINPSLQFTGGFQDIHDPATRQPGDPENVRSVSNSGSWDLRFQVPVGDVVKSVLPERKWTGQQRDQMLAQQRRLEDREARRPPGAGPAVQPVPGGAGGDGGTGSTGGKGGAGKETPEDEQLLTPEERQRREEERLIAAAEDRMAQEQEEQRAHGTPTTPPVGTGTPSGEAAPAKGPGFGPRSLVEPVVSVLRNTSPVKVTLTRRRNSNYVRLLDTASFWYEAGFTSGLDVDAARFAAHGFDEQESVTLATNTKVTRQLSLDLKYARNNTLREQVGSESRSLREEWPDVQVSLSGIEKWGLLGGGGKDGEGWFRSSSLNVSYKRGLTVNNYSATVFSPTISTNVQPRWSFTFPSGLSATLNANLKWDDVRGNGVTTKTSQSRYGLQVRHQFRAEQFLAKMGLYKPGASQNVTMDVDVAYQSDRTDRVNPGFADTAPTGQKRLSLDPRFTYQISKNLNGAIRFKFARSNNIATGQHSTTLGLGVEATFVF